MLGLILPIVFLGLLASLSPATIVVFVVVLGTARARVNAVGFLVGWGVSLTVVFAASYAVAVSGAAGLGGDRTAVTGLEIILGAALVVFGIRMWPRGPNVPTGSSEWGTQRLMGHMDSLTPLGAAVVGILKQPWAITAAAALVVVHRNDSVIVVAVAFAMFTVASTATVGLMYLYYARHPGEAQARLTMLRDRVVEAGPVVGAVMGLLVGGFLITTALLELT
jgi:hypothetical protein